MGWGPHRWGGGRGGERRGKAVDPEPLHARTQMPPSGGPEGRGKGTNRTGGGGPADRRGGRRQRGGEATPRPRRDPAKPGAGAPGGGRGVQLRVSVCAFVRGRQRCVFVGTFDAASRERRYATLVSLAVRKRLNRCLAWMRLASVPVRPERILRTHRPHLLNR